MLRCIAAFCWKQVSLQVKLPAELPPSKGAPEMCVTRQPAYGLRTIPISQGLKLITRLCSQSGSMAMPLHDTMPDARTEGETRVICHRLCLVGIGG